MIACSHLLRFGNTEVSGGSRSHILDIDWYARKRRTRGFFGTSPSYTMKPIKPRTPRINGARTRAEVQGNVIPPQVRAITTAVVLPTTMKLPLK